MNAFALIRALWTYRFTILVIIAAMAVVTLNAFWRSEMRKVAKVTAANVELKAQVEEYERDMALIKAHTERMAKATKDSAVLRREIDALKERSLTDEEKLVAAHITHYFNHGVLPEQSGSHGLLPFPDKGDNR